MAEGRPCLGMRDELHVVHYKRTSWPYEGMWQFLHWDWREAENVIQSQ